MESFREVIVFKKHRLGWCSTVLDEGIYSEQSQLFSIFAY